MRCRSPVSLDLGHVARPLGPRSSLRRGLDIVRADAHAEPGDDVLEVPVTPVRRGRGRLRGGHLDEVGHLFHQPRDEGALSGVEAGRIPGLLAAGDRDVTDLERASHQSSFWKVAQRPYP